MADVTLEHWSGLVAAQRTAAAERDLVLPISASRSGGAGAFLALAEDRKRYWVKPPNNGQGPLIPTTEQIVGRLGKLIDAPVCDVATVRIPPEFEGWEFKPGRFLTPCVAHGSLAVDQALETWEFERRTQDENARRHTGILALYDWCWGGDPQWLMAVDDDYAFYSHDHGWYFPPGRESWTIDGLVNHVDDPRELRVFPDHGLSREEGARLADALENVKREDIVSVLAAIPSDWPVSDAELEAVGWFVERRAVPVAKRLRLRAEAFNG